MKVFQIPALQDNYIYLIACPQTGQTAVVDSPDAPLTRRACKKEGFTLTTILNTHHHWDHTGANVDLVAKQALKVYGGVCESDRIPQITHPVKEGDSIAMGAISLSVLDVPGHTLGHVAYYGHGALFCGDTLFVAGCGRLFEGTPEQMFLSLQKIKSLPNDTLIYCAHEYSLQNLRFALTLEPRNKALLNKIDQVTNLRQQGLPTVPTTLAEEKSYNPFLRQDSSELIDNLRKKTQITAFHELDIFTATRTLRNAF